MAAPYATVADMVNFYDETDLEKFRGIDIVAGASAELLELLNDQSDYIESKLRAAGYAVPLTSTTPGVIRWACRVLTHHELYVSRTEAKTPPTGVKTEHDKAVKWLDDLVKKLVKLDVATDPTADPTTQDSAQVFLTVDDLDMTQGKGDSSKNELGGFAIGPINSSDD